MIQGISYYLTWFTAICVIQLHVVHILILDMWYVQKSWKLFSGTPNTLHNWFASWSLCKQWGRLCWQLSSCVYSCREYHGSDYVYLRGCSNITLAILAPLPLSHDTNQDHQKNQETDWVWYRQCNNQLWSPGSTILYKSCLWYGRGYWQGPSLWAEFLLWNYLVKP